MTLNQKFLPRGRGVRRVPGTMNKTEARYADILTRRQDVAWHRFEGVTLKLGPDTRYTPDFFVMLNDGTLECHETKGFRRDDAMVKLRVAAGMFPFVFRLFEYDNKTGWKETEVKP